MCGNETTGLSQLLTAVPVCACCHRSERSLSCPYSQFSLPSVCRFVSFVNPNPVAVSYFFCKTPLWFSYPNRRACTCVLPSFRMQTFVRVLAHYHALYVCRLKP